MAADTAVCADTERGVFGCVAVKVDRQRVGKHGGVQVGGRPGQHDALSSRYLRLADLIVLHRGASHTRHRGEVPQEFLAGLGDSFRFIPEALPCVMVAVQVFKCGSQ
ncbi:Uncharacterised protein [Mycobacteroides abscessus subsp. abscessus]|nr:Uncharacterised protein [Mycobacteroides abscessus subsp. abscessus]